MTAELISLIKGLVIASYTTHYKTLINKAKRGCVWTHFFPAP